MNYRHSGMHGARIIVLLLLVCLPSSPGRGESPSDRRFADVGRTIERLMRDERLPSVAVSVVKDGVIVWEAAFGWANREREVRATPHTPYSLASISKPFTATAVMKLAQAGRLHLDRPANEYLGIGRITPTAEASKATVRRLLSHTAGLPLFYLEEPDPAVRRTADAIIAQYGILKHPPGRFVYSNLGYGILERIVERVSGASFEEYMRREVFEPLGLGGASVPLQRPDDAAIRYDAAQNPIAFFDLAHRGASSIYASAHDLATFGMFHLKERRAGFAALLAFRTIDEMQRVHARRSDGRGYGLGWAIDEDEIGLRRVGHSGGMRGVAASLRLFPSERLAIVVLTNTRSAAIDALADAVTDAALPHYYWRRRLARLARW